MRKKIAAGNWKMNTTPSEGLHLLRTLNDVHIPSDVEVIIGVPYTHLALLQQVSGSNIHIAAQNCHYEESGAYTGEISLDMLKGIEIDYVIIGHSERREIFGESPEIIKKKVTAAIDKKMHVIFCCGEPLEVRKAGTQNDYVKEQLYASLFQLDEKQLDNVIIAYEPIWAIGTGETASPQQAQDMHQHIRQTVAEMYDQEVADRISILYGGSVKPSNASELFSSPDVDGGLVGGASLDCDSFYKIIHSF